MTNLTAKARKLFPGTKITIKEICAVDQIECRRHYETCQMRVVAVFSTHRNKQIAWFEGDNLIKTNPKPSKRYKKRTLGETGKKPRRPRKHWLAKFQPSGDDKSLQRSKRRTQKDK